MIALGDTHGRQNWKLAFHLNKDDKKLMIGDYFDSFHYLAVEQIRNFQNIIEARDIDSQGVILLIGNHDIHYLPEINNTGTSGFQASMYYSISEVINKERNKLQMAYAYKNMLFTHAGVSETWIDVVCTKYKLDKPEFTAEKIADFVNLVWENSTKAFNFLSSNRANPTGDNKWQSPIWIRRKSLEEDAINIKKAGIIQVVGHTRQPSIVVDNHYVYIDTMEEGEYLWIDESTDVITKKQLKVKSLK